MSCARLCSDLYHLEGGDRVDADGNPLLIGPIWQKAFFLAWKVRRMHASLQPVSGIEMSRTPPSANEAGGVFIICAGICLKFNTNRNLKT